MLDPNSPTGLACALTRSARSTPVALRARVGEDNWRRWLSRMTAASLDTDGTLTVEAPEPVPRQGNCEPVRARHLGRSARCEKAVRRC